MTAQIAILVPVLRRPHRVRPLLESIAAATIGPYRVLFIPDPDDRPEIDAILDVDGEIIAAVPGNYATKINRAVRVTAEPLLFLAADDLKFHPGWLENAVAQLRPGIGVVGTNDLGSRRVMAGLHSTHSLVTRAYTRLGTIDDPSRLLHEGYVHEYVDDEFIGTARARGAYAHAHHSRVEHLHPNWGKAPMDELYADQPHRMRASRHLFAARRALWETA